MVIVRPPGAVAIPDGTGTAPGPATGAGGASVEGSGRSAEPVAADPGTGATFCAGGDGGLRSRCHASNRKNAEKVKMTTSMRR